MLNKLSFITLTFEDRLITINMIPKWSLFGALCLGFFGLVQAPLLLTHRQIEAKIQECITFPRIKKQGVWNVARWLTVYLSL